jgi:hypothetical protein
MIYMRPLSHADRFDRLGLSKEFVPGVAGGVDDFLEVLEDPLKASTVGPSCLGWRGRDSPDPAHLESAKSIRGNPP